MRRVRKATTPASTVAPAPFLTEVIFRERATQTNSFGWHMPYGYRKAGTCSRHQINSDFEMTLKLFLSVEKPLAKPGEATIGSPRFAKAWSAKLCSLFVASLCIGQLPESVCAQPSPPEIVQPPVYEGHPSALKSPTAEAPEASQALEAPAAAEAIAPPEAVQNSTQEIAEPDAPASSQTARPFTIATWSGAYGQAQKAAVADRFANAQGIEVSTIERGTAAPAELSGEATNASFDAVEVSGPELDKACQSGQLAKLSALEIATDDASTDSDFLEGGLKPCGIGSFAWSQVIAVNPRAFKNGQPATLDDVFNVKRFPGKRAFVKQPRFLMEMALIADGAAPNEVYDLLGGSEGRARAMNKLGEISRHIVWVEDSAAALDALSGGTASIAQTFSGKAFFAAARGTSLDIIWDGQIYAMTYWAIPKASEKPELAAKFVKFATEPQQLAAVAQRFPYGPVRKSALALTKRHLAAGIALDRFLPTNDDNMKTALAVNDAWWDDHLDVVNAEFAAWLSDVEAANKPPALPERKS